MEDARSCEYTVQQAREGRFRTYRVLMLLSYVAFVLSYAGVCMLIRFYPLMALTPVLTWILVFFTWRYVSVSYRYEIESGQWHFTKIMNDRFYRPMLTLRISDMACIVPTEGRTPRELMAGYRGARMIWAGSSEHSPDLYMAVSGDKKTVIFFDATAKALKLLSFYNKATAVTAVRY